jgi:putative sterol carrier protein
MGDATKGFFEELSRRGHEPLLERVTGTVRVELVNGKRAESWLVSIDKGELEVSQGRGRADCVIRAPRDLFDKIAAGEANATASFLRGAITMDGSWQLPVLFQRLFRAPNGAEAVAAAAEGSAR